MNPSVHRFAALMAGTDGSAVCDLDELSLTISAALQPGLDEIEWLTALEVLAADCPTHTAEGVSSHLFGLDGASAGFSGNQDAYYDWRNSCLDRVLATRTGIPISLSVLMIEVARRVEVPLVGVGMPTHFLVGSAADDDLFFDPFDGGRQLTRDDARALFEMNTRGRMPWIDAHLDPTPTRAIAIRILNNLKDAFRRRSDELRYAMVMQLRAQLPELAALERDEMATANAIFN